MTALEIRRELVMLREHVEDVLDQCHGAQPPMLAGSPLEDALRLTRRYHTDLHAALAGRRNR